MRSYGGDTSRLFTPAKLVLNSATPEGCKTELTQLHTRPKTVTRASTNRARRTATLSTLSTTLPLRHVGNPITVNRNRNQGADVRGVGAKVRQAAVTVYIGLMPTAPRTPPPAGRFNQYCDMPFN